jgi:UTP--glucose-1-phosphate uridylyltransferase
MRGLGHAILSGEMLISNEAFCVILADDLCDNTNGKGILAQMNELYKKYRCCIVAVEEIDIKNSNKYGIVAGTEIEDGVIRVSEMVEKPDSKDAPSNLAIIGRYILIPEIFEIIRETKPGKGGEIQITDALLELAKQGKVLAYKFKGRRFDCGSVEGFVEATNYFFEKEKDTL